MQLSNTMYVIIGCTVAILLFIWYIGGKKDKIMEDFQTMSDQAVSEDGIAIIALPPEQCEKMQGLRDTLKNQIEFSKNNGNTTARKSYESALKVLEDTMNISRCNMNVTSASPVAAVSAAIGSEPPTSA
jgi:hypothetical protein